MTEKIQHPSSFRDPSGFIFEWNNQYYRQINTSYAEHYELLMSSGLYQRLIDKKYLLPHRSTDEIIADNAHWYKTILPEQLAVISYPYEWCFGQLQDAALLTLTIMKESIHYGMILKDATPYNVQFENSRPVFIDSLSFEKYDETLPWMGYSQFCRMFLFPLYLGHYLHQSMQQLLSIHLDGIPVSLTNDLLPFRSNFNLGVWLHVKLQNKVSGTTERQTKIRFSKKKMLNLLTHLEGTVRSLHPPSARTTWDNYYLETIISEEYLREKTRLVEEFIRPLKIGTALDIGANDGHFSTILGNKNIRVIAIDSDSSAINRLYSEHKKNILPLQIDIANPSPAIGFNNSERLAFTDRSRSELVLALAVLHHLVISKNLPMQMLASYFVHLAPMLLIEWIPKEDEKVQLLLQTRADVFEDYNEENFRIQFGKFYTISERRAILPGKRVLYFLLKK